MDTSRISRLDDIDGPDEADLLDADFMSDDVLANPLDMIVMGVNGLLLTGPNKAGEYGFNAEIADVITELAATELPLFAVADMDPETYEKLAEQHPQLRLFEEVMFTSEENLLIDDEEMWEVIEETTQHEGGLGDALYVDAVAKNVMAGEQAGVDGICVTDETTLRAELRMRGLAIAGA